jgi:mannose-6-phosphate isomerase-like protein (cupin superfamily)
MSFITEPKVLGKGEGDFVNIGGRNLTTFKLVGDDTQGHFGVFEVALQPDAPPTSPHIHGELSEMFYVLEGEIDILAGDRRLIGREGDMVAVPPKTIHAFRNCAQRPSKFLLLFCPPQNREQYFREIEAIFRSGAPNIRELREELDARFDTRRVTNVPFP